MLNIDWIGNDDAPITGFIVREVESQKEWNKQIKVAVKDKLKDNDGYLEIYNSDNCSTPFESVDEVLDIFSMRTVTKEEFMVLKNIFGETDNVITYGHSEDFFEYSPPAPKVKVPVLHGTVVEEIKLYYQDSTSDKVYYIQIERIDGAEVGYVVNYQNGKRLDKDGNPGKLAVGTKTDAPVSYENAKEIFDALVKYKREYTTIAPDTENKTTNKPK